MARNRALQIRDEKMAHDLIVEDILQMIFRYVRYTEWREAFSIIIDVLKKVSDHDIYR